MTYSRRHCTAFGVPQDMVQTVLDFYVLAFEGSAFRLVSSSMTRRENSGLFDLLLIFEREIPEA